MSGLFIASRSDRSRRTAVIAEEIDSIWLYLSAPGEERPERDCWLLNTHAAPARPAPDEYERRGSPPPLPADRILSAPPQDPLSPELWSLSWSDDGESVAAVFDGTAVGFITAGGTRGVARYVAGNAPAWADPWDEDAYSRIFTRR